MRSFIYNNQMTALVLGVILFLVVLYFIFKELPIKKAKKESKVEEKKEPEKPEIVEVKEEINEPVEEVKKEDSKRDKKPKIVQVYKRESRNESGESNKKSSYDPIYDRNVEFINTSKNVAKFKSFADESVNEETKETDEYGFVQESQDGCDFCEVKTKHFDHTNRLSKAIKEDNFDNMFASHISEKYLNFDADKHLNLNENFSAKLFERTEKMMANSASKIKTDEPAQPVPKYSLFYNSEQPDENEDVVEDDVKVNMKTALIAETYFGKRKRMK